MATVTDAGLRLGVDLGGTKIEAAVLNADGKTLARQRAPTPYEDYDGQLRTIAELVHALERSLGRGPLPVGVGHPGATVPGTGVLQNANSQCLNGRPLGADLSALLQREVRLANDANCLAVSEATDGAAAGAGCVFAVILGTGVGGGIAWNGRVWGGRGGIAGEWGHNPLPWPRTDWDEVPGPLHWDGRYGAIEAWCSGTGLARDHKARTGAVLSAETIAAAAARGEAASIETIARFKDRLARALAAVVNLIDPDVVVLGGGLSRLAGLCGALPALMQPWVFSVQYNTPVVLSAHGDSSGVRGAAWLWPPHQPVGRGVSG